VGLVGVNLLCALSSGALVKDDASDGGAHRLQVGRRWEELSEPIVSRQGDMALGIKSITWQAIASPIISFSTPRAGFCGDTTRRPWQSGPTRRSRKDLGITQDSFERKMPRLRVSQTKPGLATLCRRRQDGNHGRAAGGHGDANSFFWSRPNFKFQGTTLPHENDPSRAPSVSWPATSPLWLNEGLAEFEGLPPVPHVI